MKLVVSSKDGYGFPYFVLRLVSTPKRHYEFTLKSDKVVITPKLVSKWRKIIPQLESIVLLRDTWLLIRLKEGVQPQDFGVSYFHEIPEAIIMWLPTS